MLIPRCVHSQSLASGGSRGNGLDGLGLHWRQAHHAELGSVMPFGLCCWEGLHPT